MRALRLLQAQQQTHLSKNLSNLTLIKMEHKKRHNIVSSFFIPFLVMWFVLIRLLSSKTTK